MRLHRLLLPCAISAVLSACGGATEDNQGTYVPGAGGGYAGSSGAGGGSGGSAGKAGSAQAGTGGTAGKAGSGGGGKAGSAGVAGAGGSGGSAGTGGGTGGCAPQAAKGTGACTALFGFAWDGKACQVIGGCSCEGPDCGNLAKTYEQCQAAHAGCGGSYQPCAGKVCGEPCNPCEPGDPSCPPFKPAFTCDAAGQCQAGTTTCGPMCKTDADCPVFDAPCQQCADGSYSCPSSSCVNGQCQIVQPACPSCSPTDATGVGGCKLLLGFKWDGMSCQAVGGCECAGSGCAQLTPDYDTCMKQHVSCNAGLTCFGQPCGSYCQCAPDQPCPELPLYCDGNGGCLPEQPMCGLQCKSPADCPLPALPCQLCPDGTSACPQATCINGVCGVEIPQCQQPQCKTATDCPVPPCQVCPDGSTACAQAICFEGQCTYSGAACPVPSCSPQDAFGDGLCDGFFGYKWSGSSCEAVVGCSCKGAECGTLSKSYDACKMAHAGCTQGVCMVDAECPQPNGPCVMCPGGGGSCATGACVNGQCTVKPPSCSSSPCSGKACGESCSTCDPMQGACPPVIEYCDINGQCVTTPPVCVFP